MINVSQDFRDQLKNGNRNYVTDVDITLADETELHFDNTNLKGFTIEESVSDDNRLTALGAAVINQLEITIDNASEEYSEYDFTGAKIDAKVGIVTPQYTYTAYNSVGPADVVSFYPPFSAPLRSCTVSITDAQSEIMIDASELTSITLPGTVYAGTVDLVSGTLRVTATSQSDPGALPIGTYQITPQALTAFEGANVLWSSSGQTTVEFYTEREDAGSTPEYVDCGTYTVDEYVFRGGTITLTALDNMYKLDKVYTTNLIYPTTIQQVVNEICSACDIILATQAFPHRTYQVPAPVTDDMTYREVLSWCAQICGCFASFNRRGSLEFKWFDQAALATYDTADENSTPEVLGLFPLTSVYTQDVSGDDVIISGVQINVRTSEGVEGFLEGSEGYILILENNGFITTENAEEIAEWLGNQVIGLTYRKASVSAASDPTIQAGDVGYVVDRQERRFPVLITKTVFSVGRRQSLVSAAETPSKAKSTRFSESVKNYVEAVKLVEQEKSDRLVAEEALAEAIESSGGMYETRVQEESGGYTYYLHNKPTLLQSDVQMRVTDEAVGVSPDGGLTWYGLTVDGQFVVDKISTIGLDADYIYTGTIDARRIAITNLPAEQIVYDEDRTLVDAMNDLDASLTGKINQAEATLGSEVQNTRALINALNADVNPLLQSMTVDPVDGLKMSAIGSESAVQIVNDRINFLVGSQVAAYLSALGFHFDRGILTTSLSIGPYMWVYDENSGHLRLIIRN
ncbi:MAG: hypothetical protein IJM76_05980 [Lachnospiraceae bacterium]|nr:hypothetical protein [Lachnospiraceae bacterium]